MRKIIQPLTDLEKTEMVDIHRKETDPKSNERDKKKYKITNKNRLRVIRLIEDGKLNLHQIFNRVACVHCFHWDHKADTDESQGKAEEVYENYQDRLKIKSVEIRDTTRANYKEVAVGIRTICKKCGGPYNFSYQNYEFGDKAFEKLRQLGREFQESDMTDWDKDKEGGENVADHDENVSQEEESKEESKEEEKAEEEQTDSTETADTDEKTETK